MRIEGADKLQAQLRALAAKWGTKKTQSVRVGYTQAYAIYVHENMEAFHPVGQAKYLEQPARELSSSGELGRVVAAIMKGGGTVTQGLLAAGLRLQRESQQLVPVDTGALKASAFTRIDE